MHLRALLETQPHEAAPLPDDELLCVVDAPTGTPSPRHVEEFYGAGPHVDARLAPERSEDAVRECPGRCRAGRPTLLSTGHRSRSALTMVRLPALTIQIIECIYRGPGRASRRRRRRAPVRASRRWRPVDRYAIDAAPTPKGAVLPSRSPSTVTTPDDGPVRKYAVRAREVDRRQELFEPLRLIDGGRESSGGERIIAVHE